MRLLSSLLLQLLGRARPAHVPSEHPACARCKHWGRTAAETDWMRNRGFAGDTGLCRRALDLKDSKAVVIAVDYKRCGLITGPEFGCVQFEEGQP